MHPLKTQDVAPQDADGVGESLRRSDRIPGRTAPPRVIANPISGEQIVIHTSGAETDGQLLVFELFLPPGTHVPSRHTHPLQEERFTILAGTMRFQLGWHRILAAPGDTIAIPAGVAHWFGNAGAGVAHARVEVRPALQMEALFATAATIDAGAHRSIRQRLRHVPALARLLIEFEHEVAVPDLAGWLVRPILAIIARIDRRSASADRDRAPHGQS